MTTRTTTLLRPTLNLRRQTGLLEKIAAFLALFSERRRLAAMPDHMLADLGITRREAEAEARRSIWDSPSHWQA
ncbi:MAG: DUF1127 domain-containing protein [Pseudomonadota bacterium]